MKYNYQLLIEYDGTNSVGWQFQKNGLSIQESIERAVKKLIKKRYKVIVVSSAMSGVTNDLVKKSKVHHYFFLHLNILKAY